MPKAQFKLAIGPVLVHEGSTFTNDPSDPGGATKYGVSLRWLKSIGQDANGHLAGDLDHDGDVDITDIRNMTVNDAMALYESKWWNPYPFSLLDSQRVATKVFDTAVNMGTHRAFRLLQTALVVRGRQLAIDGLWGPTTTISTNLAEPTQLCLEFCTQQADYYTALVRHHPPFAKYKNGWLNRANWY